MVNAKHSEEADHLEKQISREQRRDFTLVVGRRDFYQIASDQILSFQAAHQVEDLGAGKSTHLRSARTGSECGIDDINVEREIYGLASEFLQDTRDGRRSRAVNFLRSNHMKAMLAAEAEIILRVDLAAQTR